MTLEKKNSATLNLQPFNRNSCALPTNYPGSLNYSSLKRQTLQQLWIPNSTELSLLQPWSPTAHDIVDLTARNLSIASPVLYQQAISTSSSIPVLKDRPFNSSGLHEKGNLHLNNQGPLQGRPQTDTLQPPLQHDFKIYRQKHRLTCNPTAWCLA